MDEAIRLAVVVGDYNVDITRLMLEKAKEHAAFLGADLRYIVRVPGTYDTPLLVKRLLERADVDAVATLGAVIEGQTEHDEVVAGQTARKLMDLAVEYGKPVTLGVSGPGMTRMHAQKRIESYARRATEAAVKLVMRLRELEAAGEDRPLELG